MVLWLQNKHSIYNHRRGAIEVVDRILAANVSHRSFDLAVYRPLHSNLNVFRLVRWDVSGWPIRGVVYTSAHED